MIIPLESIHAAASSRPKGYVEYVLSRGYVHDGHLVIADAEFIRLVEKYRAGKLTRAGQALWRWAATGFKLCSLAVHMRRRAVCALCEHWKRGRLWYHCAVCGCRSVKLWIKTERCPIGKW